MTTPQRLKAAPSAGHDETAVERHTVVATFPNMEAARNAIQALGIAGINGDNISLGGPAADDANQQLATDAADARVLMHILRYIIVGAVIGTIAGVVVSPLFGWIVLLLLGYDVTLRAMLVSLLLTTLMSHMIGGFIGYAMAMQAGKSWELSFHSRTQADAIVTVHSHQLSKIDRVERVLLGRNALYVHRIDSDVDQI